MNNDLISRSALFRMCEAEDNDFEPIPAEIAAKLGIKPKG